MPIFIYFLPAFLKVYAKMHGQMAPHFQKGPCIQNAGTHIQNAPHILEMQWLQHPCGSCTHHRQQQHVRLHNTMPPSLQLGLFRHSRWPAICQKPNQFVSDASGMREVVSVRAHDDVQWPITTVMADSSGFLGCRMAVLPHTTLSSFSVIQQHQRFRVALMGRRGLVSPHWV